MNFDVVNRDICVGNIRVIGVSSSSIFMIGDTHSIQLNSMFDTPPESLNYRSFCTVITAGIRRCSNEQQMFIPSQLIH